MMRHYLSLSSSWARQELLNVDADMRELGLSRNVGVTYELLVRAHGQLQPKDLQAAKGVFEQIIETRGAARGEEWAALIEAHGANASGKNVVSSLIFFSFLLLVCHRTFSL